MNLLKTIYQTLAALVKQALLVPRSLANATRLKRRQVARDEFETERLDRIRNPSKYLGK